MAHTPKDAAANRVRQSERALARAQAALETAELEALEAQELPEGNAQERAVQGALARVGAARRDAEAATAQLEARRKALAALGGSKPAQDKASSSAPAQKASPKLNPIPPPPPEPEDLSDAQAAADPLP